MIEGISSSNHVNRVATPRSPAADKPRGVESPSGGAAVPDGPPAEVLDALDAAARVLDDLRTKQVNLSFSVEGEGGVKRVRVEVRDASGELVREIPPRHLLDLLAGDTRGVTVDERG
jgi:hypothetical protein